MYAPVGFLLNAETVLPDLVTKGRQQVNTARVFGQLAVRKGSKEAVKIFARVQKKATGFAAQATGGGTRPAPTPRRPSQSWTGNGRGPIDTTGAVTSVTAPPAPVQPAADVPLVTTLAIPDYDSLAASQVVPRLEGLAGDELDAVRIYESANRGRKTILNRVDQLQE